VALLIAASGTTFALRAMSAPGHGIQPGAGDRSVPAADGIGAPTQDLRLGQGEYYFQRFDDGYGTCESWWALDDSGRLATVGGPSENGSCWGPMRGTYGPATFYTDSGPVAGLSTDPQQLLAQLTQRVRPGGASPEPYQDWGGPIEWGLIRSIGELLQAPDVTPEQKAALMDVAVGLSTSVDTRSADPEGRPAILLTLHSENQMHRWWFDPETHQPPVVDGFTVQAAGVTARPIPRISRGPSFPRSRGERASSRHLSERPRSLRDVVLLIQNEHDELRDRLVRHPPNEPGFLMEPDGETETLST
jgi:hypothetical protein